MTARGGSETRRRGLLALILSLFAGLQLCALAIAQEPTPVSTPPVSTPASTTPQRAAWPAPGSSADLSTQAAPLRLRSVDRASTSGLGVGTGLGSDNVWIGAHVVYYVQLPNPKLRVAFHVGAGVLPLRDPDLQWGVRGGSFLAYGKRHRLVLGVTAGTMDWRTFGLHYRSLASQQLFGVGLAIGYELMAENGFYLRATVGPSLRFWPKTPYEERDVDLVFRGNLLSVGYKIW